MTPRTSASPIPNDLGKRSNARGEQSFPGNASRSMNLDQLEQSLLQSIEQAELHLHSLQAFHKARLSRTRHTHLHNRIAAEINSSKSSNEHSDAAHVKEEVHANVIRELAHIVQHIQNDLANASKRKLQRKQQQMRQVAHTLHLLL